MCVQLIAVTLLLIINRLNVIADDKIELPTGPAGIHRFVSDGVKSMGYKIVYDDEDMALINEVVNDVEENSALKKKKHLNEAIEPLPAQDVKCLTSLDRHCSKEMGDIKKILIQAIKEDCTKCTVQEKVKAGKIMAAMLAHDPVAWKLFLTRYDGLNKFQRLVGG